jgi:hypothetical protein
MVGGGLGRRVCLFSFRDGGYVEGMKKREQKVLNSSLAANPTTFHHTYFTY